MDSDSNSSLLTPSIAQESSQSNTRGTLAKEIWSHTRMGRPGTTEDPKQHYCLYCERENRLKIYCTPVSTNQSHHLKAEHQITIERQPSLLRAKIVEQLQQLYLKAELSGQTSEIDTKAFQKHLNQEAINKALISLIVVRSLPFRVVEWPEFHTFCQVLNPESQRFLTTAHSQVRKKLEESWISHKDIVRRKL